MHHHLSILWGVLRARIRELHEHPEAGYTTETVVATAVLVALVLLVVGLIIYDKVVSKANAINLG